MSEDVYGWKVLVWGSSGRTVSHSGWSEGDPGLDAKIHSKLISTIPTMSLKALLGGGMGVSALFAAAGFAGSALGSTISAVVIAGLNTIAFNRASQALARGNTSLEVTLAGDFRANFFINSAQDLRALPGLLSIIPATFNVSGKPYLMGKSVIQCLVNEQTGTLMKGGNSMVRYTVDV